MEPTRKKAFKMRANRANYHVDQQKQAKIDGEHSKMAR